MINERLARPDIERVFLLLNPRTQEDLVGFLRDLGGTPPEVLDEPKILDYPTGLLRMDLTTLKRIRAIPGTNWTCHSASITERAT
ncbi:hypothetical protein [Streptomyces sp. CB02115]|uniref:hypothetical protein n=1 Tax=Streptomyces sp. CB02115 TaxID=1703939 RepID=UPI00093A2988|nr:hypothetical protein [Streptomyces sp. CB02115]OKJ48888.1 hypothetical protein AMK28_35085 [Streptomyces sp. CB02115]